MGEITKPMDGRGDNGAGGDEREGGRKGIEKRYVRRAVIEKNDRDA